MSEKEVRLSCFVSAATYDALLRLSEFSGLGTRDMLTQAAHDYIRKYGHPVGIRVERSISDE